MKKWRIILTQLVFLLSIASPSALGASLTVGTKRIAIILYNFRNIRTQPITPELIRDYYFKHRSSPFEYYQMVSLGQLHLEGDVLGWYTIDSDYSCDIYRHSQEAHLAAERAGVNLNNYDYVFYLSIGFGPNPSDPSGTLVCSTASASIGGNQVFIQGFTDRIYGYDFRTPIHEFAHSLGVHHASNYRCEDYLGQPIPISGNCHVTDEYGDPFTVMGKRPSINFLHNVHRMHLGWLRENEVEAVTQSGSYDLFPVGKNSSSPTVLKITPNSDEAYYLEYRQPTESFDLFDPKSPVVNGVSIRMVKTPDPDFKTYLLDSTPETNSLVDAPFLKGSSLNDVANGIKIKVVDIRPDKAIVKISVSDPKCVLGKPILTLQSLSTGKKPSDGNQHYVLAITNTDSSSCHAPASFKIRGNLPMGWSQSVASILPVKLLPGATVQIHLMIRAAQFASPGIYEVNEWVDRSKGRKAPAATYGVRAKYVIGK